MRLLGGLIAIGLAAAAAAQGGFPSKPIAIVVGFEPGGGTDTTARILQKPLGDQLGQQIVVENRAGGGYEVLNWYGFLGPARMPKDIVERLNREIVKALANPGAAAQMHKTGVEPYSSTPAEFGKYIEREYHTWGKVVKTAGIQPQ